VDAKGRLIAYIRTNTASRADSEMGRPYSLFVAQRPRLAIHHAHDAECALLFGYERRTGIKPNVRRGNDQWIVRDPFVGSGVVHLHHIVLQDGVGAKCNVPSGFGKTHADFGFRLLPIFIHQAHHGNGHSVNLRSQRRQQAEFRVGWGIQDLVAAQGRQPFGFIFRKWCIHVELGLCV